MLQKYDRFGKPNPEKKVKKQKHNQQVCQTVSEVQSKKVQRQLDTQKLDLKRAIVSENVGEF